MPRFSVYQLGRGREPVIVVGSILLRLALNIYFSVGISLDGSRQIALAVFDSMAREPFLSIIAHRDSPITIDAWSSQLSSARSGSSTARWRSRWTMFGEAFNAGSTSTLRDLLRTALRDWPIFRTLRLFFSFTACRNPTS